MKEGKFLDKVKQYLKLKFSFKRFFFFQKDNELQVYFQIYGKMIV